jgi:hypothetical protein
MQTRCKPQVGSLHTRTQRALLLKSKTNEKNAHFDWTQQIFFGGVCIYLRHQLCSCVLPNWQVDTIK